MPLSPQHLSDLIGSIYDCVVDPEQWNGAIEKICRELGCKCGNIMTVDYRSRQISYVATWNFDPTLIAEHFDAVMRWWELSRSFLTTRPFDEPYAMARFDVDRILSGKGSVYLNERQSFAHLAKAALRLNYIKIAKTAQSYVGRDLYPGRAHSDIERAMIDEMQPADMMVSLMTLTRKSKSIDTLSTIVLRDQWRVGQFNGDRGLSDGFVRDEDLDKLRILAPHIRRAIMISDLLNLKAVEAQTLGATLDRLALGVIIVTADARILHTNKAASSMLSAANPVWSSQGRLHARGAADSELVQAISLAEREIDIGKVGIAIALTDESGKAAVAHVLPLARGALRSQLLPEAAAAIFITQPGKTSRADLSGFADIFKLTPAETRVLQALVRGDATMLEIATSLAISEATAKTHLSHILSKTGVGRQTELIALVRDLVPPVQSGNALQERS
jgi:DNA-binding CsgD family transcriptional regulator